MAAAHRYLLELASERWTLYDCADASLAASGATSALAEGLRDAWEKRGAASPEVVLGLDAERCLSTRFEMPSARQTRKRTVLLYKLEETLPVSAEDVAAAFATRGAAAFAVACDRKWLEEVVAVVASAGGVVTAAAPMALLAAAEHAGHNGAPRHGLVAWREGERVDLVELADGKPSAWSRLVGGAAALERELDALRLAHGEAPPLVEYENKSDNDDEAGESLVALATRQAGRVLRGDAEPPLNLLAGELAESTRRRRPLRRDALVAKAALVALLVGAVAQQAGVAYHARSEADRLVARQADVYRAVFPDKRVPIGVGARLQSELRRLRGVRGEAAGTPGRTAAMVMIENVLRALPEEMRMRVLEVRVENGRLYLAGQVRSHSDADRFAAALREQGLSVSPPTTQQLPEKGVDFRLTAETPEGEAA